MQSGGSNLPLQTPVVDDVDVVVTVAVALVAVTVIVRVVFGHVLHSGGS